MVRWLRKRDGDRERCMEGEAVEVGLNRTQGEKSGNITDKIM